ncbi:MAG: type II secretion system protein [Intestinibacter bartlettii]|uniref:type II secretion system protein n=1 Tax=Intestinibacter bartlettii TaxID=261299 RepID=UPI0026EB9642|nr:type II secretion system protein [Intestinibacter bartlettii]MDO5009215.1 type II secretion system protein [Intestinibacter bartlettii]
MKIILKSLVRVRSEAINVLQLKRVTLLTNRKRGFSLVEIVIAITLMAILSGIAMTSYTKAQQDAKKNIDYTTAANIATAAQLADADGVDVNVKSLVDNHYLQSTPKAQQKDAGEFEVKIDKNGIVTVTLGEKPFYPNPESKTP